MSQSFKVFAVDDDPMIRDVMSAILEPDCQLVTFSSCEKCQAKLASEKPDLFLLDISLPGMDGYSFCRIIKDDAALRSIPVIFVSSHDTIEERVKGYDAGGEDFIVKPFEPEELLRKVKVSQGIIANQRALAGQLEEAEMLSSLVIASMDETGILLQFMSKLIAMESTEEIASETLELLHRYRLSGVVQTRLDGDTQTLSETGKNLPLEVSVIEHVRDQGRIFEFSRRSVHNFEHVTLMINNLPLEDPDYCGRLRDHLSVAAQGIDSRLQALQTKARNHRTQVGILAALESVSDTIMEVGEANKRNSEDSATLVSDLQNTLLNSFYRLGLTDNQEKFLQNMVGDFSNRMTEMLSSGEETQRSLERLNDKLSKLRNG